MDRGRGKLEHGMNERWARVVLWGRVSWLIFGVKICG